MLYLQDKQVTVIDGSRLGHFLEPGIVVRATNDSVSVRFSDGTVVDGFTTNEVALKEFGLPRLTYYDK